MNYLISQLSQKTGVTPDTIRYYGEIGLLNPERTPKGYRVFNDDDVKRLQLIALCKSFDFSLGEIEELIKTIDMSDKNSLLQILDTQITELENEVAFLQKKIPKLKEIYSKVSSGVCIFKSNELDR